MKETSTLQTRVRVLEKLFKAGVGTKKELQELSMETILQIPGISVPDMVIITQLQKSVRDKKLYSYLGGNENEQSV